MKYLFLIFLFLIQSITCMAREKNTSCIVIKHIGNSNRPRFNLVKIYESRSLKLSDSLDIYRLELTKKDFDPLRKYITKTCLKHPQSQCYEEGTFKITVYAKNNIKEYILSSRDASKSFFGGLIKYLQQQKDHRLLIEFFNDKFYDPLFGKNFIECH